MGLVLRPNRKMNVFLVTGLKNQGRVGTHFKKKNLEKNKILCFCKAFKMHKIIFFSRIPEKNLGITNKFR